MMHFQLIGKSIIIENASVDESISSVCDCSLNVITHDDSLHSNVQRKRKEDIHTFVYFINDQRSLTSDCIPNMSFELGGMVCRYQDFIARYSSRRISEIYCTKLY